MNQSTDEDTLHLLQSCEEFVDREQVEVLSFNDKYLSAEIHVARLQNGRWIMATEHAYHTGNYAGHGGPLSGKYENYATREEALDVGKLALERKVAGGVKGQDSLVNDNQREAFERFLRWLSPQQKELALES